MDKAERRPGWRRRLPGERRLDGTWLPPLLVWGCAAIAVALVAVANGYDPTESATWFRWDSRHYLDIARDGYQLYPCPAGFAPGSWCGDAGWFPGYPWLVAALGRVGLDLAVAAVLLAWLFTALTLALLWSTFLERRATDAAVLTLLYAAVAPGQIYGYAIFPMSMLALFTVGHLWCLHRGRFIAAGCAGAFAAAAYPLGVLLVPVSAVWLLAETAVPLRERLRRVAWASGLTAGGAAAMAVAQRIETGRWNAYFLVQDKYDHEFVSPFDALRAVVSFLREGAPLELAKVPAMQTAFVTAVLAVVIVSVLIRSARRRSIERLDLLLVLWALATWVVPLSQTNVSPARSEAALVPLALLVGRLPPKLAIPIVLAAAVIAVAMEGLFLDAALV